MSQEWAHDAAWKEVPTVNKIGGYAVATDTSVYLAVAGACPRGDRAAQLVQDSSGLAAARTAMPGGAVTAQLQKYPFTTQGAVINGAKSGPHRAWDPV
jgi:hypothetical protein